MLTAEEAPPSSRADLKDPNRLDLHYGRLQTRKGNLAEARTAFDRVLEDDARSVEALIGLARLEELSAGDSAAGLAVAEAAFRRAVDAAPDDPRSHAALGRFLADRGRWSEAEAAHAAAVRLDPDDRQHRFALAVATARGGDLEGAREHFTASVGEAEAHYNLGSLQLAAGRRDAAEAEFRAAVLKKPDLTAARLALAAVQPSDPQPSLPQTPLPQTPAAALAANPFATAPPAGTPGSPFPPATAPAANPFAADVYAAAPVMAGPMMAAPVTPAPRSPAPDPFAAPAPFATAAVEPQTSRPDILQAAADGGYAGVTPAAAVAPSRVAPPRSRPTPWATQTAPAANPFPPAVNAPPSYAPAPAYRPPGDVRPTPQAPPAAGSRGVTLGGGPTAEPPPWPFK